MLRDSSDAPPRAKFDFLKLSLDDLSSSCGGWKFALLDDLVMIDDCHSVVESFIISILLDPYGFSQHTFHNRSILPVHQSSNSVPAQRHVHTIRRQESSL